MLIKEIGRDNSSSTVKRVSLRTVLIAPLRGLSLRVIVLGFGVHVRHVVEGKTRTLTWGSGSVRGSIGARRRGGGSLGSHAD